jgi:hypothetical protein
VCVCVCVCACVWGGGTYLRCDELSVGARRTRERNFVHALSLQHEGEDQRDLKGEQ